MKFEPHEYQTYCIRYIESHPISALLLDMGLGKTAITLTAIRDLIVRGEVNKVLVTAPLRVARDTWPSEIEKWEHLQDLTCSVIVGDLSARIKAVNRNAMIYIINRENIKWLADYYHSQRRSFDFDMIVLDELSSFKNFRSQRFRYMRQIRSCAKRVVGLTGTPTSNGLMDLWAEIGILDEGVRLGRYIGRYRETYFDPKRVDPRTHAIYSYQPKPGAEDEIYRRIADITISMKAKDYLKMPDCISTEVKVGMSEEEQDAYETLKREMVLSMNEGDASAQNAASLSGKLLQMANGAVYDENGQTLELHKRKLDALEDFLESANGQSLLIAYWFRHDRDRIMKRLKEAGYCPKEIRTSEDIRDWNEGRMETALIHPASAGHGLNLQRGGHILIWFGLTWSLELYQQTNARLWRQGQENVVTICHIICRNTIDEDVMRALKAKEVTQEKLIAAVKARLTIHRT